MSLFLAWMLHWFIQFNRSLNLVAFLFLSDTVVCPASLRGRKLGVSVFLLLSNLADLQSRGNTHNNLVCHSYLVLLLQ